MKITIGERDKTRWTSSVCTEKRFDLSDREIYVSTGTAHYNDGTCDDAAHVNHKQMPIEMEIIGALVNKFRACTSPEEAKEVFFAILFASFTVAQLETLAREIEQKGFERGQRDIRNKFRELMKVDHER